MALGFVLNGLMRAAIVVLLVHARRNADDPRYAGKGIGTRALVMLPLSVLVPAVHAGRRGRRYPLATDNLNLSIYTLDLAGNALDLYDRHRHYDLLPHFHGTGAATVVLGWLFRVPMLTAFGLANAGHILLEAQEYYSDVLFGFRNVRGEWDTINDLVAGLAGSAVYAMAWRQGANGTSASFASSRPGGLSRSASPSTSSRPAAVTSATAPR